MLSARPFRSSWAILFGLLGAVEPGCGRRPAPVAPVAPPPARSLTAAQAIARARAEYLAQDPGAEIATMTVSAERDGDAAGAGWLVRFQDDPPRPGGHATIQLDPAGKFVRFWGGL